MSSHEIFDIKTKSELSKEQHAQYDELIAQHGVAKELGLTKQVDLIGTQAANYRRCCLITNSPLTSDELIIWRSWLPKHYTTANSVKKAQDIGDYAYHVIPCAVLNTWKTCKDSRLFESFEIFAGDENKLDNVLVGVNGNVYYLVARWSAMTVNFLSFEKIKRELELQWLKNLKFSGDQKYPWFDPRRYNHPDVIFGSIAFAFVLPILFEYDILLPPYTMGKLSSLVLSLGLGFIGFVISRRRMVNRLRLESPLIQAISVSDDILKKLDTRDLERKPLWFSRRKKKQKPCVLRDPNVFNRPHPHTVKG